MAVTALALAGCGSSSGPTAHAASTTAAAAPACVPAAVNNHSARLAGTSVDVSPTPGTDTADPHTQISFLGVPAAQIQVSSVVGRRSGTHSGTLRAYSQGDGASFVPAAPFDAGEQVVRERRRRGQGGVLLLRRRHPVLDRGRRAVPQPGGGARR